MHTLFAEMESTFLVSMSAYIDIFYELINYLHQGWIYWGGAGGVHPLALARGVLFFMIKQKIIRDKMRFSNLSNNMMISKL
jgi:hypothetical protein